jgi:murein DD-endopeptidase MepM/ murein hydrolase activator NlpD
MIAVFRRWLVLAVAPAALAALLASCLPSPAAVMPAPTDVEATATPPSIPVPTRSPFPPGTIIEYAAQNGDTLPAVAAHFNTTIEELLVENPELPAGATTLPPGFVLRVPAYFVPLTGSPFHLVSDSDVVNGPTAIDFDIQAEVESRPGFLANLSDYAFRRTRPAWQVVEVVARNYSIHPRLLLTLLEHQTQALTKPFPEGDERTYPLGYRNTRFRGLYRQLIWAAEQINDGYYGWRSGTLSEIELADGRVVRPDPWWNAGTTGLHFLFASMYGQSEYEQAVGPEGFYATYARLWGDPEALAADIIPANLQQPELILPFEPNRVWDFTAGPHYSWGTSLPLGALDFAPPAAEGGCVESDVWVAAPAAGMIVRSGEAAVVLDLDGDGDERTGWVIFFFHIAEFERIAQGQAVEAGALLGHPSCEGGQATGTHVHIARRYNGEWIPAAGALPFVMDGWVAAYGAAAYEGTLTRGSSVVPACTCSSAENRILYEFP